jgi:putative lipoic acid-binding regulatory protein
MTDESLPPGESLLKFPCDFTLKVFGLKSDEFEAAVLTIVHQHAPNFSDRALQVRDSKNGKYCALNITVYVESREQLDGIYQALTACPQVLMAL